MGVRHFLSHLLDFPLVGQQKGFLFGKVLAGILQVLGDALRLSEELLQFEMHRLLQVVYGNLIVALAAEVFGVVGTVRELLS